MMSLWRVILISAISTTALAEEPPVSCRVVGVHDGDTLTCLTADQRQIKVRLGEIDAPEIKQPWGDRSKQGLSNLCFGRQATLNVQDTDRYGRTVARVICDGRDANVEQLHAGLAWLYRQYLRDTALIAIEQESIKAKRGLWGDAQPIPPWEWRRGIRENGQPAQPPSPAAPITKPDAPLSTFTCSGKTRCGQMTSCAEARFYLEQCGVIRLDGDHDGTPCESICR